MALAQRLEVFDRGYIAAWLEAIEVAVEAVEIFYFFLVVGLVAFQPLLLAGLYLSADTFRESFFGIHTVKGVVYFLPSHREVAQAAEMPVTEHFLLQLREFYVEAVVTAKFAGKGMEKEWEEFFFCFFGKIDALSMCVRVRIYKRWKPGAVGVKNG